MVIEHNACINYVLNADAIEEHNNKEVKDSLFKIW